MKTKQTNKYITTPIYYPNDVPHIGTAYPTIAADIIARWSRLRNQETFFLTGTDEHGKKIESAALKRGITPQELVDQQAVEFKQTFSRLDISYDRFIRTTDRDHLQTVQEILNRVFDCGDIYQGIYEGLYCVECETYYPEEELNNGDCPLHFKPAERLKEDCYYFRLSKYSQWLLEYYRQNPDFILPTARRNEVISFVKGGLEDLCISRSTITWGIPLPFDASQVTYVWFDALLNYVTGAGFRENPEMFAKYWENVTHIIGKDILRFHAVIFPAMLRSAGIAPPRQIFAHGFWTVNGRKFSKSLGNSIAPEYLIKKYGLDPLRYYMFRAFPFGSDGNFSERDLVQRNNTELAQGLGNLIQRTLTMIEKYCNGVVPESLVTEDLEKEIRSQALVTLQTFSEALDDFAFHKALEIVWNYISLLNNYINTRKPWKLAENENNEEKELLYSVLAHLIEGLRFISCLVTPFMPTTGKLVARRLGLKNVPQVRELEWGNSLSTVKIEQGDLLFPIIPQQTELSE